MPTYDYVCDEQGHNFEAFQRFSDEPLKECTVCGAPVRRVIHPAGIIFKGDGWYATANRSSDEKSKFKKDERGESADSDKSSAEPIKAGANGDSSNRESSSGDSSESGGTGGKSDSSTAQKKPTKSTDSSAR
jgi:putative FmdB family regulatory protein